MKKFLLTMLVALLIMTLLACQKDPPKKTNQKVTLTVTNLSEREKAILSLFSNDYAIFDFNQEGEYKKVSVWIEKYKSGDLVKDYEGKLTTEVEKSGSIMFAKSRGDDEGNQPIIHVGIGDHNGSLASEFEVDSLEVNQMSSVWSYTDENTVPKDGRVTLASLCYSRNEDRNDTLRSDFYKDPEGHINELKQFDIVYLLKAEFSK